MILPSNQSSALVLLWQLLCHQMQSSYSSSKFVAFFFHQGDSFYSLSLIFIESESKNIPKVIYPKYYKYSILSFCCFWAVWAVCQQQNQTTGSQDTSLLLLHLLPNLLRIFFICILWAKPLSVILIFNW